MNLKSWTTTFTLILLLLLLHLIMIIILFINYFQSQWVRILSPSTTPPHTTDPKKSLPHPQFHLRCKLSTWSELSRHLMAIIVSLPTLVIAHWQRQRIRLTTSGCRWGLISRANKIIFQWNALFEPFMLCSSSPDLGVDVGWEILYLLGEEYKSFLWFRRYYLLMLVDLCDTIFFIFLNRKEVGGNDIF